MEIWKNGKTGKFGSHFFFGIWNSEFEGKFLLPSKKDFDLSTPQRKGLWFLYSSAKRIVKEKEMRHSLGNEKCQEIRKNRSFLWLVGDDTFSGLSGGDGILDPGGAIRSLLVLWPGGLAGCSHCCCCIRSNKNKLVRQRNNQQLPTRYATMFHVNAAAHVITCLLYTSDAADE